MHQYLEAKTLLQVFFTSLIYLFIDAILLFIIILRKKELWTVKQQLYGVIASNIIGFYLPVFFLGWIAYQVFSNWTFF
ncbi:MAG: hypothetical protein AAB536_00810 [Patescibacteria group bacterium]